MSASQPDARLRRTRFIFLVGISLVLMSVLVVLAINLADVFGTKGDLGNRQQTLNPLIYQQATLTMQWAEARQTQYFGTATAESAMTQSAATFAAPPVSATASTATPAADTSSPGA